MCALRISGKNSVTFSFCVRIFQQNPAQLPLPLHSWMAGQVKSGWLLIWALRQMTLGMLSILLNHLSANEVPFEKLKLRLKLSFIKDLSYFWPKFVLFLLPLILGLGILLSFSFVFAYLRGWLGHRNLQVASPRPTKRGRLKITNFMAGQKPFIKLCSICSSGCDFCSSRLLLLAGSCGLGLSQLSTLNSLCLPGPCWVLSVSCLVGRYASIHCLIYLLLTPPDAISIPPLLLCSLLFSHLLFARLCVCNLMSFAADRTRLWPLTRSDRQQRIHYRELEIRIRFEKNVE